jgi:phosphoglycolate phosphatase
MTSGSDILRGATIAFDLDGTLVDTAPDLIATLNHILTEEGIAPLPFEAARPFIGHGARRLLEKGLHAQGQAPEEKHLDALLVRFIDHYRQHSADLSSPFPGVVEALTTLKTAGARLAVCTNKLTFLSVPILDALDLAPFFDSIIGADLAPAPKPDPRHLMKAVETAGGRIDRAIMVGDASPDAGAARAAGAKLILVSFGYTEIPAADLKPDRLIDHYDQLIEACIALLSPCPEPNPGL